MEEIQLSAVIVTKKSEGNRKGNGGEDEGGGGRKGESGVVGEG